MRITATAISKTRPVKAVQRANQINMREYDSVKAAIESKGAVLLTTKEEFDQLPVPVYNRGRQFGRRKIKLLREGSIHPSEVSINAYVSGSIQCLTEEEKEAVRKKQSEAAKERLPKGVATSHNHERDSNLVLINLLDLAGDLDHKEVIEFRVADWLFRRLGKEANRFVADQVKSAQKRSDGSFNFNLTVGSLCEYLKKGLSVTCIGMVCAAVAVVYFFTPEALEKLGSQNSKQAIRPMLLLKLKSRNKKFTDFLAQFRYEVGSDFDGSAVAIEKLRHAKLAFADTGVKFSYEYWNFYGSQVTSDTHKTELASFLKTRDGVTIIGGTCEKLPEDNYGPVDFRINGARIQDKVVDCNKFTMCQRGSPYDPDSFEVLMLSKVKTGNQVGLLPMRRRTDDGSIVCNFSPEELSKHTIRVSNHFNARVEWFDRGNPEDMRRLIQRCTEYVAVPPVTRAPPAE